MYALSDRWNMPISCTYLACRSVRRYQDRFIALDILDRLFLKRVEGEGILLGRLRGRSVGCVRLPVDRVHRVLYKYPVVVAVVVSYHSSCVEDVRETPTRRTRKAKKGKEKKGKERQNKTRQ